MGRKWGSTPCRARRRWQGEVNLTPLQIANLGATIANRGYYYVPHVVQEIEDEKLDTLYTLIHPSASSAR